MGKGSSDKQLPKDVYAALPKDPDQQLEVAQQITQIAVSGHVAKIEAETSSLRQRVAEKDAAIVALQARVVGAEISLAETTSKLSVALEGQAKLIEDKNLLTSQVKKLMRQVSKLNDFKKALLKSLEEDSSECNNNGDDGSMPSSSLGLSSPSPRGTTCESLRPSPMSKSIEPPTPTKRKQQGTFSCMMPEQPSPKSTSKSEDRASSKESPRVPRSPADSPRSPAKKPRIDGKDFFRQARSRFSYEEFNEFLSSIKQLNAHRQAKELQEKQNSEFHPKIYSCNTHVPPNCGDWVCLAGLTGFIRWSAQ